MARKGKKAASEGLSRKDYEKDLAKLHAELVKLQRWVKHAGRGLWWYSRDGTRPAKVASSKP